MRMIAALLLGLLPACSASLDDPPGGLGDGSTSANDAAVSGADGRMATPDAAAVCTVTKAVYLNFEGQVLTKATRSNAPQNQAAWMNQSTGTAPKFRATSGTRGADITAITNGVASALSGLGVEVVTARPASGPYMMIVYGGTADNVGSKFGRAVQQLDCGNVVMSDVGWIGDAVSSNQVAINTTLGAIGFGVGLTATNDPNDCMCGWDNACTQTLGPCTLAAAIATDPDANQRCPNQPTQMEQAVVQNGFCP